MGYRIRSVFMLATCLLWPLSAVAEGPTGSPEPVSPASNAECSSHDLTIGPLKTQQADLWEQRADAENTGQYVPADSPLSFQFNQDVDLSLVNANISIKSFGKLRKDKDGKWIPCGAATEPGETEADQVIEQPFKSYMGLKSPIINYHTDEPFVMNCPYVVELKQGPLTKDGKCLAEDTVFPFQVTPDKLSFFERETADVSYDLATGELRSFRIKPNVTLRFKEMWRRYKKEFGWRGTSNPYLELDDMVQVGEPKEDPTKPGWYTSQRQQKYLGVPVEGAGFVVRTEGEFVRSVLGRFVPKLNLDVKPTVSESAALDAALAAVGAQQYVWDWKPNQYSRPKGKLVIVPADNSQSPKDFRLVWQFEIAATQPLVDDIVTVDAHDITVPIQRSPQIWYFTAPTVNDMTSPANQEVHGKGYPLYDSTPENPREDFSVGMYQDDQGTPYYVLRSDKELYPPLITLYEDASGRLSPIYALQNSFGDGVDDTPGEAAGVSVHWAITRAVKYVNGLFGLDPLSSNDPSVFPTQNSLVAIVSENPARFAGHESEPGFFMKNCYAAADSPMIKDQPCFYLNMLTDPATLKMPVSPEVIGHELYHMFTATYSPHVIWNRLDSGPILEGLADLFGKLLELDIRGSLATWLVGKDIDPVGQGFRDLSDPEDSPGSPKAGTYKGAVYQQVTDACETSSDPLCGVYKLSPIVGHAFSLMINGQAAGTFNDLGCDAHVSPLSTDPTEARKMAGQYLWKVTSTYLGTYPWLTFYSLRDATMLAALESHGGEDYSGVDYPPEVKTIMDAWHAVGVGNPSWLKKVIRLPKFNEKDVYPWPVNIGVVFPPGAPRQQIQISTSLHFDQDVQVLPLVPGAGLIEYTDPSGEVQKVSTNSVFLKPNTHYYWRYRTATNQPWGSCAPVSHFFTTSLAPSLRKPLGLPRLNSSEPPLRELDFGDALEWTPINGATSYFVRISEQPDDRCDADEVEPPPDARKTYTVVTAAKLDPEAEGFALEPGKTYYWYAKAIKSITENEKQIDYESDCSNGGEGVPFEIGPLPAPKLHSPQDGEEFVYQSPRVPFFFAWNPVAHAVAYKIALMPRNDAGVPTGLETYYPVDDASREGAYVVKSMDMEMDDNGYCWKVQAEFSHDRKSDWSEPRCFTLKLETPKLSSPIPNEHLSLDQYLSGEYLWSSVPGAASYKLFLYRRLPDGSIGELVNTENVPDADYEQGDHPVGYALSEGFYYCWAVAGVSPAGVQGPVSDTQCFAVTPSMPVCAGVEDYTDDVNSRVVLHWSSDYNPWSFSTDIKALDKDGNVKYENLTTQPGSQTNETLLMEPEYKTIKWQVTAIDPMPGGASQVASECTWVNPREAKKCITPTAPTNLQPAGGIWPNQQVLPGNQSVTLSWSAVEGATKYEVYLYRAASPDLGYELLGQPQTVTTNSIPMTPGSGSYYFGVKAGNDCYEWSIESATMDKDGYIKSFIFQGY